MKCKFCWVEPLDSRQFTIHYCHLHAAAEQMRDALEIAEKYLKTKIDPNSVGIKSIIKHALKCAARGEK